MTKEQNKIYDRQKKTQVTVKEQKAELQDWKDKKKNKENKK